MYYPLGKMVASVLQWPLLRDRSTPKLRPFEGILRPVFGARLKFHIVLVTSWLRHSGASQILRRFLAAANRSFFRTKCAARLASLLRHGMTLYVLKSSNRIHDLLLPIAGRVLLAASGTQPTASWSHNFVPLFSPGVHRGFVSSLLSRLFWLNLRIRNARLAPRMVQAVLQEYLQFPGSCALTNAPILGTGDDAIISRVIGSNANDYFWRAVK